MNPAMEAAIWTRVSMVLLLFVVAHTPYFPKQCDVQEEAVPGFGFLLEEPSLW